MGSDMDLGVVIGLLATLAGIGVLFAAFAGAYFFGKSRAQHETLKAARDPELVERITRIEQIVEATAIEIERISEGQRFTTRLLGERKAIES
jgi:high-affinity K+ transport system ATPase subunit B